MGLDLGGAPPEVPLQLLLPHLGPIHLHLHLAGEVDHLGFQVLGCLHEAAALLERKTSDAKCSKGASRTYFSAVSPGNLARTMILEISNPNAATAEHPRL